MSRRGRPTHQASERPIRQWVFLLAGCGFGLALIGSGLLVRTHGTGYQREGAAVPSRDVTTVGGYLIAMGAVAILLTLALAYLKHRAEKASRKRRPRRRSRR